MGVVEKFGIGAILKHRDYRELFYCYPLLLLEIIASRKSVLMGKLLHSDDPFDVVFISEEIHTAYRSGQRKLSVGDGIWIQFKEIKNYVEKNKINLDKWVGFVQREYIDKIRKRVKLNPPGGILHLHNSFLLNSVKRSRFESFLKKLKIPQNFPYKYISLTIEVTNTDRSDWRIIVYQLHPVFKFVFDINQVNYLDISKIITTNQ